MGTGSFPGVKRLGRGVNHSPHLAPKLKKEYSYISTPPSAFLACSRVNFTLYIYVCMYIYICIYVCKDSYRTDSFVIKICLSLQVAPDGWIPHITRSVFRFPYYGLLTVFIITEFFFQQFLYELRFIQYSLCFNSVSISAASCRLVKWARLLVATKCMYMMVNSELCFRSVA